MKIKLQKTDYIFIGAIAAFTLMHVLCMFIPLIYNDEFLYPTVPLRFINGDNMIQHEWHLTQFSAIFLHLPISIWLNTVGSTEGIIFFLRFVYLIIHIMTSFFIYWAFRNYGIWAVFASVFFYTQVAYRMFTVSYMTLSVIFLLSLGIFLFLVYQKRSKRYYIFAGTCFASVCVCNPLYCVLYIIYILVCTLWQRQLSLNKAKYVEMNKKQKRKADLYAYEKSNLYEIHNIFFSKKSVALFSSGIFLIALICVIYFIISGGTISSLSDGIENMLMSTEYGDPFAQKIKNSWNLYSSISLKLPFLLPLHYLLIFLDADYNRPKHRIVHLLISAAISLVFAVGVAKVFFTGEENAFALSLPFIVFSFTCYILTKNKNIVLACCLWWTGVTGAVFQFLASNTLLTSFFAIMVILHIPGIIFVRDLFIEIKEDKNNKTKNKINGDFKRLYIIYRVVIIIVCFIQISVNIYLYAFDRIPKHEDYQKATYGPLSNFYLEEEYYTSYVKSLNDLDVIKARSKEDDPVLIFSLMGWMHLYIERPCAAYSTSLTSLNQDLLKSFYKQNPDKIPRYIYVAFAGSNYNISDRETALDEAYIFKEMFDCSMEELTMGFLLTVNDLKQS